MCYKKNKYLIFDIMRNDQIFPSKACHFHMITDSFLGEKLGTSERTRRYVGKNLLNLDCQDSIRFAMFQAAYKWGKSFGKSFSFPFSAKCFDRNLKCIF